MDRRYDMLKIAVERLATEPEGQLRYLDDLFGPQSAVQIVDELALEFDDAFSSHEDMLERGLISADQIAMIRPVDEALRKLGADERFWVRQALIDELIWAEIREVANAALPFLP